MSAQRRQHMNGSRAAAFRQNKIIRPTGLLDPGDRDCTAQKVRWIILSARSTAITATRGTNAGHYTDEENGGESDGLPDQCLGSKVRYLHSEIDTLERMEILRDLRLGVSDVLVGINLLA